MDNGESRDTEGESGWHNCVPDDVKLRDQPLRDITKQAVWTLSSCKHGYGVTQLLSDNVDKYWQSDGPQPHTINIEFPKKTDISFIMIYLDFKNDESYTPSKISAKMGTTPFELSFTKTMTFNEPQGWQVLDMRDAKKNAQRGWIVQLQVVQNHQNGRDTHIRHVRIVGPGRSRFSAEARLFAGKVAQSYSFPAKITDDTERYMDGVFNSMTLR